MSRGRVYLWTPDPTHLHCGRVRAEVVPLSRLENPGRLCGRHVEVRNGGAINVPNESSEAQATPLGDAEPNDAGVFLFEPGRGGGRIDKALIGAEDFRWRYEQASHFGEVNTYFHLDAIAAYVHELLAELGAPPLPRVIAFVNAHHAVTCLPGQPDLRDGLRRGERWVPFQGGHYRLPSRHYDVPEYHPIAPTGEIHLGPGRQLLHHGALVEAAGGRYRANASHNAGILYHEYGHHIARHTADFRGNALRRPDRQNNRKTALEEGTCDYWAATMLDTPHIWAWHHRHDEQVIHPRSLASAKTINDYVTGPDSDAHANGTIWASALWSLRTRLGARVTDLLDLQALLLIGELPSNAANTVSSRRRARKTFAVGLAALLCADDMLHGGRHRSVITNVFFERGIQNDTSIQCVPGGSR